MAELGGAAEATVIGSRTRLPAANAAFANAMLCHGLDYDDTHSDSVSHVSTVITPAALAAAEQLGASGREALAAIVAGNEVVCRVGMAASGRVPRARLPSDRDLRDLRRRRVGRAPRRARRGDHDARARDRRLLRGRPVRIPRRRDADEADAPRLGGARGAPRDAPRGARRRRAGLGARGQVRPLPRLPRRGGGRDRHRRAAVRPRQPLGDAADRLQAVPRSATSCTARSARRARRAGRTFAPDGDRRRARHRARGGRLARARAGGREGGARSEYEGKFSLQYSIASLLVRGHVAVRDFTDEAIGDPAVLAVAAEGALRDEAVPDVPAGLPGGAGRPARRRDVVRGGLPAPEGRPGEPALARRGAREVPRQRRPRALPDDAVDALEEAILSLDELGRRDAPRSPR